MVALYPAIIIKHDIILCIPKLFLRLVLVGRKNHVHVFRFVRKKNLMSNRYYNLIVHVMKVSIRLTSYPASTRHSSPPKVRILQYRHVVVGSTETTFYIGEALLVVGRDLKI